MSILIVLAVIMAYLTPGFYLARGMYGQAARQIASKSHKVIPNPPPRPEIKVGELLHTGGSFSRRCNLVKDKSEGRVGDTCTCDSREEWIKLRNGWIDYNDWNRKYGDVRGATFKEPTVNMLPIYASVPAWPVVAGGMFIKGGAKNIPDYREIERMENELKELN